MQPESKKHTAEAALTEATLPERDRSPGPFVKRVLDYFEKHPVEIRLESGDTRYLYVDSIYLEPNPSKEEVMVKFSVYTESRSETVSSSGKDAAVMVGTVNFCESALIPDGFNIRRTIRDLKIDIAAVSARWKKLDSPTQEHGPGEV